MCVAVAIFFLPSVLGISDLGHSDQRTVDRDFPDWIDVDGGITDLDDEEKFAYVLNGIPFGVGTHGLDPGMSGSRSSGLAPDEPTSSSALQMPRNKQCGYAIILSFNVGQR